MQRLILQLVTVSLLGCGTPNPTGTATASDTSCKTLFARICERACACGPGCLIRIKGSTLSIDDQETCTVETQAMCGDDKVDDPPKCSALLTTTACVDTSHGKAFPLPTECLIDHPLVEPDAGSD